MKHTEYQLARLITVTLDARWKYGWSCGRRQDYRWVARDARVYEKQLRRAIRALVRAPQREERNA